MKSTPLLMATAALSLACISCTPAQMASPQSTQDIQALILHLENAWAQVDVTNDRSIFTEIIAPEFHGASSRDGKILDRAQWLANWEYEGVTSATNIQPAVHVVSPELAIFNGIDETKGRDGNGAEWVHQDLCTDTWVKRNGKWQVVAAHCSRIK